MTVSINENNAPIEVHQQSETTELSSTEQDIKPVMNVKVGTSPSHLIFGNQEVHINMKPIRDLTQNVEHLHTYTQQLFKNLQELSGHLVQTISSFGELELGNLQLDTTQLESYQPSCPLSISGSTNT
tara:strand:- start:16158 stop:16538 length:381 start_codon:yes stop_codon:yes gene_type:complete